MRLITEFNNELSIFIYLHSKSKHRDALRRGKIGGFRTVCRAERLPHEATAKIAEKYADDQAPKCMAEKLRALLTGGKIPSGRSQSHQRHNHFVRADPNHQPEGDAGTERDDRKELNECAVRNAREDAKAKVYHQRLPRRRRHMREHRDENHRFGDAIQRSRRPRYFPAQLEPSADKAADGTGQHRGAGILAR
jgi:hypothetical protein